jgi:hypothetical protein
MHDVSAVTSAAVTFVYLTTLLVTRINIIKCYDDNWEPRGSLVG